MFLFVLGCFIVKGPLKWALLGATIFSVLLSWGKNFMGLTDFFIDYVPMYNKFRAVSSILVIAEFTIPLLAIFALKEILGRPGNFEIEREPYRCDRIACADSWCLIGPGCCSQCFLF